MNWNSIVSAQELSQHLDDRNLVLVDARFALANAMAGEQAWHKLHLPNAAYVHLDRDLSDKKKPAEFGRHPLPDAEHFCRTLMRCGISPESQVVVYDTNDGAMAAARFWYLLRLLGHEKVAVLNGGFAHWLELGLPVDNGIPHIKPSVYHAEYDQSQLVSAETVRANISSNQYVLIDARAAERYRGEVEPIDKLAGHIPKAVSHPFSLNLDNDRFRSPEELMQSFQSLLGGRSPSEAIFYCGSGVTACHNLLAMEYAGLHGAKFYSPSWSGWISDPDNSIA